VNLGGCYSGSTGVPVKGCDGPSHCSMILKTVINWHHHVSTLVLGHLYLPFPGGGSGSCVDINVDGVAHIRGWDPHMLPSVVPTDYRW